LEINTYAELKTLRVELHALVAYSATEASIRDMRRYGSAHFIQFYDTQWRALSLLGFNGGSSSTSRNCRSVLLAHVCTSRLKQLGRWSNKTVNTGILKIRFYFSNTPTYAVNEFLEKYTYSRMGKAKNSFTLLWPRS